MSSFEEAIAWGHESGFYESLALDFEDYDDTPYVDE